MKILIASDHGGYVLKNELIESKEYEFVDCGCFSEERTDYPIYAFKMCEKLLNENYDLGIAICKTGIGMSIACNKVKNIRCAKIDNINDAKYAKCHNNANVLAISSVKTKEEVLELIKEFANNEFMNEQHLIRLNMIKDYENEH